MNSEKNLGYKIKLDTTGTNLSMIKHLVENELIDYIAMDIKSSRSGYAKAVGIDGIDISPVLESVKLIMESGVDYEFRTTLVKNFHTDDDILCMAQRLQGAKHWFLQSFKDSGDLIDGSCVGFSDTEMREKLDLVRFAAPFAEIRGV